MPLAFYVAEHLLTDGVGEDEEGNHDDGEGNHNSLQTFLEEVTELDGTEAPFLKEGRGVLSMMMMCHYFRMLMTREATETSRPVVEMIMGVTGLMFAFWAFTLLGST